MLERNPVSLADISFLFRIISFYDTLISLLNVVTIAPP